ncbi:MAG: peptidylprolyl isomerase, partial [Acidobacteriota bacterium]
MKALSLMAPLVLLLMLVTGFPGGEASAESALPNEQAPAQFRVKFETTRGPVVIEVNRKWAPLGADRFYNLVKSGYFDNVAFFRVIPGFVVQFGINGDPEVSAKWQKANISDDPVKQSNHRGYLTFDTSGPNTRTTQMFINLTDNTRLDRMGFAP